jgi:DNA-binding response OmpR family regulator
MKRNLLLLANDDAVAPVMRMLAQAGHEMQCLRTSRQTFRKLNHGLHDLDAIIVDLDPAATEFDGIAVLEALTCCEHLPPIIVLTGLEESYMTPIALEHGAAACIGKPFAAERLRATIERVTTENRPRAACTCDLWGHLSHQEGRARGEQKLAACV